MTFIWKITYIPLDQYGIPWTTKPRIGHVHVRTKAAAMTAAEKKYGCMIVSVE